MSGEIVPKHMVPSAPVITSTVIGGLLAWRGSAGALKYSVQRRDTTLGSHEWKTICDKCATDADDPWIDPHPVFFGVQYRVTAWNLDGVASQASAVR